MKCNNTKPDIGDLCHYTNQIVVKNLQCILTFGGLYVII